MLKISLHEASWRKIATFLTVHAGAWLSGRQHGGIPGEIGSNFMAVAVHGRKLR